MDVRLQAREELLKGARRLEALANELLDDYERSTDRLDPPAPASRTFEEQRRELIETMPDPHQRLFKGEAVPCTCPRYAMGGRRATDPTCPLHRGDARD